MKKFNESNYFSERKLERIVGFPDYGLFGKFILFEEIPK
jgi:hypothetical protein